MYVILCNSQKKPGEKVALVDRNKCKAHWWTERIEIAMVFEKLSAAEFQLKKIRFNKPQIWTKEKAEVRLRQVRLQKENSNALTRALNRKVAEWHDDDWHEGMND
jgi:hypothetical protein